MAVVCRVYHRFTSYEVKVDRGVALYHRIKIVRVDFYFYRCFPIRQVVRLWFVLFRVREGVFCRDGEDFHVFFHFCVTRSFLSITCRDLGRWLLFCVGGMLFPSFLKGVQLVSHFYFYEEGQEKGVVVRT